jgi:glutaredoxin
MNRQTEALTVYWAPGCSSCLRTKEFLTRHGVDFVSVNVVADQAAFD